MVITRVSGSGFRRVFSCDAGLLGACRAVAPIRDFSFVDFESTVVNGVQARAFARRAVHVLDGSTLAADKVVMVIAGACLE